MSSRSLVFVSITTMLKRSPKKLTPRKTPPKAASSHPEQQEEEPSQEQSLRDYKVTIEYKHLKSHAPGGVYLIPSLDEFRTFHGVIFVRRGPYMNGIFKFILTLPLLYNDLNQHPKIIFTNTKVYSPFVNYESGELDIRSAYPRWDPARHYLVTVLTFLKKIFYSKDYGDDAMANLDAKHLAKTNPPGFHTKVDECVRDSQKQLYDGIPQFSEEKLAHRVLRELLYENVKDPNQVAKNAVLAMIHKAKDV